MKLAITLRLLYFPLLVWSAVSFTSCKVMLLPAYDAELSKDISATAKEVDNFFLVMEAQTADSGKQREFQNFSTQYATIQADINSIYNRSKIKPLNVNSTRVCEIIAQLWTKYTRQHKEKNMISDGNIELRRLYMQDAFLAAAVAENGKKFIENNPSSGNP